MVRPAIVLVDKPAGVTSHDVVARARKAFGTRKVGHAGTLDPMATGLLVLGVEGATRLLTYLVGLDKTYLAIIRLGQSTSSDDADGEISTQQDASHITADQLASAVAGFTGVISQVPSSVSAIKVDGRRAYDRVRAGEEVQLTAREVTVSRFEVLDHRPLGVVVDVDVAVDCSSGTYIRALARDLGTELGVGGHLTALRRTHVGPFDVADAAAIDAIGPACALDAGTGSASVLSPARVASEVLGELAVTATQARDLRHGKRLPGLADRLNGAEHRAAIDPDGKLVGVVGARGADIRSVMNMPEEAYL